LGVFVLIPKVNGQHPVIENIICTKKFEL